MEEPLLNPFFPTRPPPSEARFSLRGLMGIVTVMAICLGVAVNYPVLGVGVGVLLASAWIRASLAMRRLRSIGGVPTLESYMTWILSSLGIFVGTLVVAVVSSVAAFWAGFLGIGAIVHSMVNGIEAIAYGVVAGILFRAVAGPSAFAWLARRYWHIHVSVAPREKSLARGLST